MGSWEIKGKPALVIIHMQRATVGEDGKPAFRMLAEATKQAGIIPRQQALLERFRKKKLPIIYIVAVLPNAPVFPAYGKFWELHASLRPNLPGSRDIEVIPELAPQPGEAVIGNWPIGGFSGSNLGQLLKDRNVGTLILTGVATEHAVLATALEAVALGYSVIVPNEGCTSFDAKSHEMVMNNLLPGIGLVTTTADVLAHI